MIVVTLSNWRKKLKIFFVLVILLAAVALTGSYLLSIAKEVETSTEADRDRSPSGSLKVQAQDEDAETPEDEGGSDFLQEINKTLKSIFSD